MREHYRKYPSHDNRCQNDGEEFYIISDFRRRKIFIRGEISFETSIRFAVEFDKMCSSNEPFTIDISSPGGDVISSLDIYNKIRTARCLVNTLTFGIVASGALLIFVSGDRRFISERAIARFHWPIAYRDNEEISPDSTKSDVDYFNGIFKQWSTIIAARTGLTSQAVQKYMRYSRMFVGKQVLQMGIATLILNDKNFDKKFKKGNK
jgi:ATP-dependent protease ClpP protease subunit